jgi:hypothetical protein
MKRKMCHQLWESEDKRVPLSLSNHTIKMLETALLAIGVERHAHSNILLKKMPMYVGYKGGGSIGKRDFRPLERRTE